MSEEPLSEEATPDGPNRAAPSGSEAAAPAGDPGATAASPATVTLVIHGHFYQPPREDPRTGAVPVEPSAAPWHDWNSRIASECYHPNTAARIVDREGRITALVDNYRYLSFNVGPTLLAWMERAAPDTYHRIVAAGRATRGAIAQGFHHTILPLCSTRDRATQIRWGRRDFRYRFGYDAAGFWMPETAVNDAVLRELADQGVGFVILAPGQLAGAGGPGLFSWAGDARMTLAVYDGDLSHDLAFGAGAMTSESLVDRVLGTGRALVMAATDGETFGHHHKFADRTLAYAFATEGPERGVRVRTVADVVAEATDLPSAQVRESAWSCAHGVGRWQYDCGCSTGGGPGWHQRWREPLRSGLDVLRDAAASAFEARGAEVLVGDPWTVRDEYVDVCIGARTWEEFASEHVRSSPSVARALLEAQRHAMAMYTSCGWFFNDIAGIEARIVLRHAHALVDRMGEVGVTLPVPSFTGWLAKAEGNQGLDGDDVWAEVLRERREERGTARSGAAGSVGAGSAAVGAASFAPVVHDIDAAQEMVFAALRGERGIELEDVPVLARALGIKVDPAASPAVPERARSRS